MDDDSREVRDGSARVQRHAPMPRIARRAWQSAAILGAVLLMGWAASRDPVAATYARNVERLQEPRPVSTSPASITMRLLNRPSAPGARILVGGRDVATFDSGEVHLEVRSGDRVTLDARKADGQLVVLVQSADAGRIVAHIVADRGRIVPIAWAGDH